MSLIAASEARLLLGFQVGHVNEQSRVIALMYRTLVYKSLWYQESWAADLLALFTKACILGSLSDNPIVSLHSRHSGRELDIYLIPPSFEDMDNREVLYHTRAYSEPPIDWQGVDWGPPKSKKSEDFNPLALPMPGPHSPQMELEVTSHTNTLLYVPVY